MARPAGKHCPMGSAWSFATGLGWAESLLPSGPGAAVIFLQALIPVPGNQVGKAFICLQVTAPRNGWAGSATWGWDGEGESLWDLLGLVLHHLPLPLC